MARNFTNLKKNMSLEQLNKFCRNISEEYAKTPYCISRTYFCNTYNITQSCYEKVKEYAIVNFLVSDSIVELMRDKAVANQQFHSEHAGTSTWEKFDRLMEIRSENLIRDIARKYAVEFAYNPDISKSDLAASHGMKLAEYERCLVMAIEENIADDNTVDAMEERSINNAANPQKAEQTKNFFVGLRAKREANKKGVTLN